MDKLGRILAASVSAATIGSLPAAVVNHAIVEDQPACMSERSDQIDQALICVAKDPAMPHHERDEKLALQSLPPDPPTSEFEPMQQFDPSPWYDDGAWHQAVQQNNKHRREFIAA